MILLLFAVIFGTGLLNIYSINFDIKGLNRVVVYTPIELMLSSVEAYGEEAAFDKEHLIEILDSYYSKSLSRYCKEYDVKYYFYNEEDHSLCLEDYCSSLEINVNATVTLNYKYHRGMYYHIKRGHKNG